jgi:hypothetical protein
MLDLGDRKTALLALTLLVPAASIGIIAGLYIAPGSWGQTLSVLCQVWLLVFPIAWSVFVDRKKLRLSQPKRQELLAGAIWGIFMFAMILGIYRLFGQHWIDPVVAKQKSHQLGISSPNIYLIVEAYFVLVNSLIEEFTSEFAIFHAPPHFCNSSLQRLASCAFRFLSCLRRRDNLVAVLSDLPFALVELYQPRDRRFSTSNYWLANPL